MPVPVGLDGCLPHPTALRRWLAPGGEPLLHALPRVGDALPDAFAMAGVVRAIWSGAPAGGLRWRGRGGGEVLLAPSDGMPLADPRRHAGALPGPWSPGCCDGDALERALAAARLADAAAVAGLPADPGPAWAAVLAALDGTPSPAPRPAAGPGSGAWNPLPFARRGIVAVRAGADIPWTVRDAAGRILPVQVVEGPHGREALIAVELGALAATTLEACDGDGDAGAWEVTPAAIDNGRLRAELDAHGRIVRLGLDGAFAELGGPLVEPRRDGAVLAGAVAVTVLEDGPVRARVAVAIDAADGRLDLLYSLAAHEGHLRVQAAWSGDPDRAPVLAHPAASDGDLVGGDAWGARRAAATDHAWREPMAPEPGWRWARIAVADQRSPLLAAGSPLVLRAEAGVAEVWLDGLTRYALTVDAESPGRLAEELGTGLLPHAGPARAAPWRWAGLGALVPLWAMRESGAIDLLLANPDGAPGSAWLFPAGGAGQPARRLPGAELVRARERDAWRIDHAPGALFAVRWDAGA